MSISILLPVSEDNDINFNTRLRYSLWCSNNLSEDGKPRTWKIHSENGGYSFRVVFYNTEDAVAFKLRFGL